MKVTAAQGRINRTLAILGAILTVLGGLPGAAFGSPIVKQRAPRRTAMAGSSEGPRYEPEASAGDPGFDSGGIGETSSPNATRLALGFGAASLVLPRCTRADGGRRCRHAVIRSFAKRPANRTIPCCARALVGGRLTDGSGRPLAGQRVDVIETFARGAFSRTRTTIVTTNTRGGFKVRLAPGPSRRVGAVFLGTDSLSPSIGRRLRLRVRASVRMRASTAKVQVGGAPVVFVGRVAHPGAGIPPTGLLVEMEFRLPGTAWCPFRVLQTDRSGRFRYPYTFEDDDSAGVRFQFRAFVPAMGNWAFAPATSRARGVTG